MEFTNSSLICMTAISPNRHSPRNQPITKITVHHTAGVMSIEQFAALVANPAREMSANYMIGNDGRIVLTCPESDRSWCSSSPKNDHRAITIEVSNSAYGGEWPIGNKAYNALIMLCIDICKRNGIPKLEFTGDPNGSLTFHYMFAATACPGPWMKAHAQDLCDKVNAQLTVAPTPEPTSEPTGYTVSLVAGTEIYDAPNGKKVSTISTSTKYTIVEDKTIDGYKYGKLRSGAGWVIVEKPQPKPTGKEVSYTVSLKGSDLVYESAGGRQTGTVGANGVFTIIEEATINGTKYGKLKSGIGWVIIPKATTPTASGFKVGDLVKINTSAVYYNGGGIPDWVKRDQWYISSISGDRAVLGENVSHNRNIQSPINTVFLTKTSGASYTPDPIKVGDWVKVTNPIIYGTNKKFTLFVSRYKVIELKGDRAVISSDGRNVTAAISTSNIVKA